MSTTNHDEDAFLEASGYYVGDEWYPRVTKIVEIKAKPALYRYYARLGSFELGEKVKEQSASEGTLVHNAVEALLQGEKPFIPPDIEPAIKAFAKFADGNEIRANPDFVEFRVANHDHRYAGTLDAIATIDGKVGVLDIKTSKSIYRDYNLQTAAYYAVMKEIIPNLSTRWILRIDQHKECHKCGATLRTKGGSDKIRYDSNGSDSGYNNTARRCLTHDWSEIEGQIELKECGEWENDFSAFLGAKRLWEWENEALLRRIGYL